MKRNWSRWIFLTGLLAFILVVSLFFPWQSFQNKEVFIQWTQSLKHNPWAAPIFVSTYAVSCLFAPVTPFSVAGGALFGFWKGLFLNLLASNLGTWMAFGIARVLGHSVVQKLLRGKMKAMDTNFKRHGFVGVLIMRIVGIPPFIMANYLSGLSDVGVWDYASATFIGVIPWTLGITYFSNLFWQKFATGGFREVQQSVAHRLGPVILGVMILGAVTGLFIYFLKRRKISKEGGAHVELS